MRKLAIAACLVFAASCTELRTRKADGVSQERVDRFLDECVARNVNNVDPVWSCKQQGVRLGLLVTVEP